MPDAFTATYNYYYNFSVIKLNAKQRKARYHDRIKRQGNPLPRFGLRVS